MSILAQRLKNQREGCESFFEINRKSNYEPKMRLEIQCYYIKLNDLGVFMVRDLAKYLAEMITQYVHTLADFVNANNNPRVFQKLSLAATKFINSACDKGETGQLILWMLLEGVLGVPKVLTKEKTSLNQYNFGSDGIHAYLDPTTKQLIIYIGESKLRENINNSINSVITSFDNYIAGNNGKISFDQDVYLLDKQAIQDVCSSELLDALNEFARPGSIIRSTTLYYFCVFTGYNSTLIREITNLLKNEGIDSAKKYLSNHFNEEVDSVFATITKSVSKHKFIRNLRLIWFAIPFEDVNTFVEYLKQEVTGAC